jgi:hypothetical protein
MRNREQSWPSSWRCVNALKRLRDELALRVAEHTLMQLLDSKLRVVCEAGTIDAVADEWKRIMRTRRRLVAPHSAEVASVIDDMEHLEGQIDAAASNNPARPTS